MSDLPKGWLKTKIGDVANVVAGGTPKANNPENFADPGSSIAWLTPADLSGYKRKGISHGVRDLSLKGLETSSAKLVPKGSVLFSSRAPIGYVAIAENEIATNQGFKNFVFTSDINSTYAYYYLKSIKSLADSLGTGTTFKELSGTSVKKLPFIIAPLNEQIRIANKLDSQLAKVDVAKTRLDKIPTILKRFRQSILTAAVSGQLTEEWRENTKVMNVDLLELIENVDFQRKELGFKPPRTIEEGTDSLPYSLPKNWYRVQLGSIALKITDGAHNTPKVLEAGFPYLMAKDLSGGILDFSENKFISEKDHRELHNKCKPEIGDLLVVNIGAGTGNNVIINADVEFSFKNIAIIKRPDFVLSKYLKWHFDARKDVIFNEQTRGGAQPFLSLKLLNMLEFALPPLEEQSEIVRRVDDLFAIADTVEKQYHAAKSRVDKLTQSILAKAFRGELVPQEPNDEPAEKLLERIQALREQEKKKQPKKKRATKSKTKVKVPSKPRKQRIILKDTRPDISGEKYEELLKIISNNFGEKTFTITKLVDATNLEYEELKDVLFELIKCSQQINIKPKLKMQWDGEYLLKATGKI